MATTPQKKRPDHDIDTDRGDTLDERDPLGSDAVRGVDVEAEDLDAEDLDDDEALDDETDEDEQENEDEQEAGDDVDDGVEYGITTVDD